MNCKSLLGLHFVSSSNNWCRKSCDKRQRWVYILMAIENAQRELFRTGTDFEQIRLLDNFYDNINVEGTSESDLIELLQLALKSGNDYIRRSAFKILCDLTLTNKVGNPFPALGELHNLLQCDEPSLLTVAIKYLPYFRKCITVRWSNNSRSFPTIQMAI